MTRFTVLFSCFILGLSLLWANPRCLKLKPAIREATERYLPKDYPVHYNIAAAETESSCEWQVSQDGHGSIGYFQLTPKFLDKELRSQFPDYTKEYSKDHFYAFAYYLSKRLQSNPTPQLWIVYQRYNGGEWVVRECKLARSWKRERCEQFCRRKKVCVKKEGTECVQNRNACKINYKYSFLIHRYAQKYREREDGRWRYW